MEDPPDTLLEHHGSGAGTTDGGSIGVSELTGNTPTHIDFLGSSNIYGGLPGTSDTQGVLPGPNRRLVGAMLAKQDSSEGLASRRTVDRANSQPQRATE